MGDPDAQKTCCGDCMTTPISIDNTEVPLQTTESSISNVTPPAPVDLLTEGSGCCDGCGSGPEPELKPEAKAKAELNSYASISKENNVPVDECCAKDDQPQCCSDCESESESESKPRTKLDPCASISKDNHVPTDECCVKDEQPRCCGDCEPEPEPKSCPEIADDHEASIDNCCAQQDKIECCDSPCCAEPESVDSCCSPKVDLSSCSSRAASDIPILSGQPSSSSKAKMSRRKHARLPPRCFQTLCCCAKSVQKRLVGALRHRRRRPENTRDPAETLSEETEPEENAAGLDRRLVVLSVLGMDCPSCSPRVVRALTRLPSVADCTVDVFAGRATATYRPEAVSPKQMAQALASATGFTCDVLEDGTMNKVEQTTRRMSVRFGRPFDARTLAANVSVVRERGGVVELEYEGNPRDVLAALAPWDPTYVPPISSSQSDSARRDVIRLLKLTSVSVALCIPVLVLAWAPLPPNPTVYGGVSLGLTTIIQLYVARQIYLSGIRALVIQHTIDMDLLVSISTGTAYLFSTIAYACAVAGKPIAGEGEGSYFETAALLVTLIMCGRLISAFARRKSTDAISSLNAMQSNYATLVVNQSEQSVIPIGLIQVGDVLRIGPNELVPTDGRVESGQDVYVDESAITGESVPVAKRAGAILVAGTTALGEGFDMRVTVLPEANTLARMADLLRAAQGARLRVQDTADKVAGWLAPVVLMLGAVTIAGWIGFGIRVRGEEPGTAAVRAIGYAVAVLVVSCPCAIALCVPMVAVIAVAVGTKRGVLFKTVEALENACDTEVVVFDKTGTLTAGKLAVESASYYPTTNGRSWSSSTAGIQALVRTLSSTSSHPVSVAVLEHVTALVQPDVHANIEVAQVEVIPGKGVQAVLDGCVIRGGKAGWATGDGENEHTTFVVSVSFDHDAVQARFEPLACFTLSDSLRPDSVATVEMLARRGTEVHILSGDVPPVVVRTAESLGIPTTNARGSCTPEEKAQWIRYLQTGGTLSSNEPTPRRKVMFIGDGTNDALALAQADVGVSLGSGTDVASSAAQVVLLSSLSSGLKDIFDLAFAARRRVRINFGWAMVYNVVAILFASGVLGKVRIPPEYAGLGELVSVLPVVVVAWSLGMVGW